MRKGFNIYSATPESSQSDRPDIASTFEEMSEQVKDIIGKRPRWIVRYGSAIILMIIVTLIGVCGAIPYPRLLKSTLTLTAQDASIYVQSASFGKVARLLVENNQNVKRDQVIGYLETSVNVKKLLGIDSLLDKVMKSAIARYPPGKKPVYPYTDLTDLGDLSINLAVLSQQYAAWIKATSGQSHTDGKYLAFLQALAVCQHEISEWKRKYLFLSPIEGIIQFADLTGEGQVIKEGVRLFYIQQSRSSFFGTISIQQENLNTVKPGQQVILEIAGFHAAEYGNLMGVIDNVSPLKDQNGNYPVKVSLPSGGVTTLGTFIQLKDGMNAEASIVTRKETILSVLFQRLKGGTHEFD